MFRSLTIRQLFLVSSLMIGANPYAWAAPNLWWDHFEAPTPDQGQCVKQAVSLMTAQQAGQITSSADSVRAWSEKTVGVAECIPFGDKLVIAVLVSSSDVDAGSALFNALKAGMMKK
jgi:hypothetical protein